MTRECFSYIFLFFFFSFIKVTFFLPSKISWISSVNLFLFSLISRHILGDLRSLDLFPFVVLLIDFTAAYQSSFGFNGCIVDK